MDQVPSSFAKRAIGTSLIGVAIGTAVAIYAQSEPVTIISKGLSVLAPALAVVGDQISSLLAKEFTAWWHRRGVDKTRDQINEYLLNPHTSDEHKENLKRTLESVEMQGVNATATVFANPPFAQGTVENKVQKVRRRGSKAV
jgi:hypothetical protein